MSETESLKTWLKKVFVIVVLIVASFGAVVVLARFNIMEPGSTIMLGVVLFVALWLVNRQRVLSQDVKMLKDHAWDLEEYEKDMDRRIDQMGQRSQSETQTPAARATPTVPNDALLTRIKRLETRIEQLEYENTSEGEPIQFEPAVLPTASMNAFNEAVGKPREIDVKSRAQLQAAIKRNKLDLHLQPLVELPTRKPAFFESFMRLQTGEKRYLEAAEFLKLAEDGDLMPMIDAKVVFASVRMLRTLNALKRKAGLFCNISGRTLSDTRTFNKIAAFLEANKAISPSMVLEIDQRHFIALKAKEKARLGQLADMGYSLSLDRVADLNLDAEKLFSSGIRFVKIPATIMLHANVDDETMGIHPSRVVNVLSKFNITVIATEIERETQAVNLIDFDIEYGQGLLFAPPRPVKAELLDAPEPGAKGRARTAVVETSQPAATPEGAKPAASKQPSASV